MEKPEPLPLARTSADLGRYNGGVFLGLNGIVIKSHGGASAEGFAVAIDIGYDMVRQDLLATALGGPRICARLLLHGP